MLVAGNKCDSPHQWSERSVPGFWQSQLTVVKNFVPRRLSMRYVAPTKNKLRMLGDNSILALKSACRKHSQVEVANSPA